VQRRRPGCRAGQTDAHTCHRALTAALDAMSAVDACNEQLTQEGAPPFQIRIGVEHGPLIRGNMGSAERLEYTVIGDTVNLAARLEGSASPGRVLTTVGTLTLAEERAVLTARAQPRGAIRFRGKEKTNDVVELFPPTRDD